MGQALKVIKTGMLQWIGHVEGMDESAWVKHIRYNEVVGRVLRVDLRAAW